jgi:hypothetical protein
MNLEIQNFTKDKNNQIEHNGKNKVDIEEQINREST